MNERNKHILDEALQQLPTYSPAESVWEKIEDKLDPKEVSQETLGQALQGLASYRAPDKIWDQIEDKMDRRRKWMPVVWSAAAIILLLIIGIPFILPDETPLPRQQASEKAANIVILDANKIAELSSDADSNEVRLLDCFQQNLPLSDSAQEAWDALMAIEGLQDSLANQPNPIMKQALEATRAKLIQEMLDAHCLE